MSHILADYVRILARGKNGSRDMTFDEALFTMQHRLSGDALPEQIGAVFMLMRVKEESPEELAGFAAAINELWPTGTQADLIWPSYAGKRRQPFWCFLSMLLLNQMGYRILAHGTESHTAGRIYLHQVFEAFNLPIIRQRDAIASAPSLAYLPCSVLNPVLQQWLGLKAVLGVRSPINTVMKTLAPAGCTSVQGVFHPNYGPVHTQAAALNKTSCIVIKGEGGEFEVNPERTCKAHTNINGDAIVNGEAMLNGDAVGIEIPGKAPHIEGKLSVPDIQPLADVWNGVLHNEYAEEAVLRTAALALCAIRKSLSYDDCLQEITANWQQRQQYGIHLVANV